MPWSHASDWRSGFGLRSIIALALVGMAIGGLSGCGKSKAERDAEQAATDARYEAAAAAEWEREHKLNQADHLASPETAQPAPKIPPAMAAAIAGSNAETPAQAPAETLARADTTPPRALSDSELHEMYKQMMAHVANNLPRSDTNRFYDAYMNRSHTAVCGSVDYEVWSADGARGRSKRQRFFATMDDAIVDTDAPGVHATFERMIAPIDCTPGTWRDTSR
jgi:hypothetical protein